MTNLRILAISNYSQCITITGLPEIYSTNKIAFARSRCRRVKSVSSIFSLISSRPRTTCLQYSRIGSLNRWSGDNMQLGMTSAKRYHHIKYTAPFLLQHLALARAILFERSWFGEDKSEGDSVCKREWSAPKLERCSWCPQVLGDPSITFYRLRVQQLVNIVTTKVMKGYSFTWSVGACDDASFWCQLNSDATDEDDDKPQPRRQANRSRETNSRQEKK